MDRTRRNPASRHNASAWSNRAAAPSDEGRLPLRFTTYKGSDGGDVIARAPLYGSPFALEAADAFNASRPKHLPICSLNAGFSDARRTAVGSSGSTRS